MTMRMDKLLQILHVNDNEQTDKINVSDLIDFVARIDVKFDTIEENMNSLQNFIKKIKHK